MADWESIFHHRDRLMITLRYLKHRNREDEALATLRMMSTSGRKKGEIFLANLCLQNAVALREKVDRETMSWENQVRLKADYVDAIEKFHEVVKKRSVAVLRPLPTTRDC